jgi:hypothetical protein
MSKCGKAVKPAENGASRGNCTLPAGHNSGGGCSNDTCKDCGVLNNTSSPSYCRKCRAVRETAARRRAGISPQKYQIPGRLHTFPCGCSGRLPLRGKSNQFAVWHDTSWSCRISGILSASVKVSRRDSYTPISRDTPHHVIRKLMDVKECWRCKQKLGWLSFSRSTTPHLHHNHETGEVYGFTHGWCNPRALEHEIDELRNHICELESELGVRAAIAA